MSLDLIVRKLDGEKEYIFVFFFSRYLLKYAKIVIILVEVTIYRVT